MTTLYTREKNERLRVPHHPGRYPLPNPEAEAAWRATQKRRRLMRAMFVLTWISFVGMLVAIYIRRAS